MESPREIVCKKVAVVVLGYNSRDYLSKFIPTILQTDYHNFDTVYVDNASTDDSVEYVEKHFPEVKIFRIYENHGFTGGYTESLPHIKAEYYVLLNSDVEVTPGWLKPQMELMEKDETVGVCQPKTLHYYDKEKFDYAGACGGYIDKYGYAFCRGRIFNSLEEDQGQYESEEDVFWATGACMLIRSELYHRLGGLDNHFYAHMEEIDLCWRVKNAAYKVMVVPSSVIYHVGGSIIKYGSFSKFYHNYRNNLVMMYKNLPSEHLLSIIIRRMILDGVAATRALILFRTREWRAIFMAHLDFWRGMKKWKKRRKEVLIHVAENRDTVGIYPRSIVFDYFLKGKKKFSQLKF